MRAPRRSMTVYQSLIKHNNPKNVAVFGTSAGGALVLEMMLRRSRQACRCLAQLLQVRRWQM